jgi:hypothetical protein
MPKTGKVAARIESRRNLWLSGRRREGTSESYWPMRNRWTRSYRAYTHLRIGRETQGAVAGGDVNRSIGDWRDEATCLRRVDVRVEARRRAAGNLQAQECGKQNDSSHSGS